MPGSERGVACPGELPAQSDPALVLRAERARAALGDRAFVLGHHYQRDEVIRFADVTGDSFKLARDAAARPGAEFVIFCGVHFMAESADILTSADAAGHPARPGRGLLDGRHGDLQPGRGVLGDARGPGHRRRGGPGHVHELLRRHQGLHRTARRHRLHVIQREAGADLGASARAARSCSCPTSTWAVTPRCSSSACASTTAWSGTRAGRTAASTPRRCAGRR